MKQFIDEFQNERGKLVEQSEIEHESSQNEIDKLERALELKSKEINKVKKLGKTILEQRTEMETMFLEALDVVKKQILLQRVQQRKESMKAYQNRMISSVGENFKTRPFNDSIPDLTANSSFFRELEDPNKLFVEEEKNKFRFFTGIFFAFRRSETPADLNVADFTWQQREQVLREMFVRMNTRKSSLTESTSNAAHLRNDGHEKELSLVQTGDSSQTTTSSRSSSYPKLPQIMTN